MVVRREGEREENGLFGMKKFSVDIHLHAEWMNLNLFQEGVHVIQRRTHI